MHLAYLGPPYDPHRTTGGNAHIGQFLGNTVELGHQVWTWGASENPSTYCLPKKRVDLIKTLRRMDAVYIRLEWLPPRSSHLAVAPYRQVIGSPCVVWEFNTVPEFGRLVGASESVVRQAVRDLRYYGRGCDLAICVSRGLAEYVRDNLSINNVALVPNGSDPDLFHPDVPPLERVKHSPEQLGVVWMGSADLPWHNLDLLRGCAEELWKQNRDQRIIFHILGQADVGMMRSMPPNVNYHGAEEYSALPRWLSAMDVGLVLYRPGPSDYSSPLKLFDYMASGLTVVSTPQPQVCEVFEQLGQQDLLVPPDDPVALADVLSKLAHDRERVRKLGNAGRQLVIDFYNWRRVALDITNRIEAALATRK